MASSIQLNSTNNSEMKIEYQGTSGVPKTVVVPDVNGEVIVKGTGGIPCFSAYQSVSQSLSASTPTKLTFSGVEFDTTNAYDETTNFRFQPQVAGYYYINGSVRFDLNSGVAIYIYKNGSNIHEVFDGTNGSQHVEANQIVYMNGTSDYIEIYCWTTVAGNTNVSVVSTRPKFQAHLIVGA